MRRKFQQAGVIGGIILLFLLFGYHCPFQWVTGLPCPGCNMTTSLYWLLQGNLSLSLTYHALLLPTLFMGILCLWFWGHDKKNWCHKLLMGWAILMIIYYGIRMVFIFPDFPMIFDQNSLLGHLLN